MVCTALRKRLLCMRAHTTPRITKLSNLFAIQVGGSQFTFLVRTKKTQSLKQQTC